MLQVRVSPVCPKSPGHPIESTFADIYHTIKSTIPPTEGGSVCSLLSAADSTTRVPSQPRFAGSSSSLLCATCRNRRREHKHTHTATHSHAPRIPVLALHKCARVLCVYVRDAVTMHRCVLTYACTTCQAGTRPQKTSSLPPPPQRHLTARARSPPVRTQ